MRNVGQMLKQAKEMQSRMAEAQERIAAAEATGVSGGGLVEVTLSGKGDLRKVRVDPSLMKEDEREILEDLIVAAHAEARAKVEALVQEEMSQVTGGLALPPGFGFPA